MKNRKLPIGCIVVIILGIALGGWALWNTQQRLSFENWIKENDQPIVERLNKGAKLFTENKFGEAAVEFSYAYTLAKDTDEKASIKWKDHVEKISPPRKFYEGNSKLRWESGLSYFKNRIVEACYGLASSINKRVMQKYRAQINAAAHDPENHFTPPPSELQPALTAIEQGLQVNPQSEKLRLLRAEIYLNTGLFAKAENEVNELLLISPELADAYNLLGIIYTSPIYMYSSSNAVYREKAISMFEKAAMFRDSEGRLLADPHYNLGMFYATPPPNQPANTLPPKADALKALKHLREYLKLAGENAPDANHVKVTIKKLEKFEQ